MLETIGLNAKVASKDLAKLTTIEKNNILYEIKKSIEKNREEIKIANKKDLENAKENDLGPALIDRLTITDSGIDSMIDSIDDIIKLDDPIGKISDMKTLENGLIVGQRSTPLGVIAIIYESRPDVSLNCSLLTIKSSNGLILKGGKEAINSNIAIVEAIRDAIEKAGYNPDFVQLITDNSREVTKELMKLNDYVDILIPRGSRRLINTVVKEASLPVLKTGDGNCHVYVDASADIDMAYEIVKNSKTQRVGVCNAMETLLVHEDVGSDFYEKLQNLIEEFDIDVYGDEKSLGLLSGIKEATDEDYYTEYHSMAFAIKTVKDLDQAIDHINKYSTNHSESIVTSNYENAQKFLAQVDSACVYINASTRFTDGGQLGLGAEMGISTQKMHARGPVGLDELTSKKYIIYGNGQVRI